MLEDLAADGVEIATKVLDWRQLAKLKSTYADALVECINAETNRVHTSFSMVGASTGRLSSSDPNVQNIPIRTAEGRQIRTAFVAAPGHKLVSADYSQIELRLVAHVANETTMIEAFRAGVDIHARTASEVFGVLAAHIKSLPSPACKKSLASLCLDIGTYQNLSGNAWYNLSAALRPA